MVDDNKNLGRGYDYNEVPPTDQHTIPELRAEKFNQAKKELEAQIQRLESLAAKTTDIAVKQETLDKINGLEEKLSEMRDNR